MSSQSNISDKRSAVKNASFDAGTKPRGTRGSGSCEHYRASPKRSCSSPSSVGDDCSRTGKSSALKHRKLWDAFWNDRDSPDAFYRLMEAWMPFVQSVLRKIAIRLPSHVQLEDLMQVATLGLCEAISRFDPGRGVAFEGFAYHRIKGAIMDELRTNDHLSKGMRAKVKKARETICRLTDKNGAPPSDDELAEELGMSANELAVLLDNSHVWLSLDQIIVSDENGKQIVLQDILADSNTAGPDAQAERSDVRAILRRAFRGLTDREQKILYLYYFEELRLVEIAVLFDLTEARICQIHGMAVMKLKAAMNLGGYSE